MIYKCQGKLPSGNLLKVEVKLHQLKGNRSPYFSVTATEYERGRDVACGCMHEEILSIFPDLADAIALHLADYDGKGMYWWEDGWYHLQEGKMQWAKDLWRCTDEELAVMQGFFEETKALNIPPLERERKEVEAKAKEFLATMFSRWKAEADAVIQKYKLEVVNG